MADCCEVCGTRLSFRNSLYYEKTDVCKECYKKLVTGEIKLKKEVNNVGGISQDQKNSTTEDSQRPAIQQVEIIDIDMPFSSMVSFMVKWAIASLPAIIILIIFFMAVSTIFGGLFLGMLK